MPDLKTIKRHIRSWASNLDYKVFVYIKKSFSKNSTQSDFDLFVIFGEPVSVENFRLLATHDSHYWEKHLSTQLDVSVHLYFYHPKFTDRFFLKNVVKKCNKIFDYRNPFTA